MSIGQRVRARREELGLSQEAVARGADISLRAVTDLELGISTNPHYLTLKGLANALDTSITALVGEEESSPKKVQAPLPLSFAETQGEGQGERRDYDVPREVLRLLESTRTNVSLKTVEQEGLWTLLGGVSDLHRLTSWLIERWEDDEALVRDLYEAQSKLAEWRQDIVEEMRARRMERALNKWRAEYEEASLREA